MKVIKHGNQARDWTHEATCSHCGCVMEVHEGDAQWYRTSGPGIAGTVAVSELRARCPECAEMVRVCAFEALPRPMQERLERERERRQRYYDGFINAQRRHVGLPPLPEDAR